MKIQTFDRQALRVIRDEMDEALTLLEAIGIHAKTGRITFNASTAVVKVDVSMIDASGEVHTKEAMDYDDRRVGRGLPELGTEFGFRDHTYTITGWAIRSRKYPVLAERKDGKAFKFTPGQIKTAVSS